MFEEEMRMMIQGGEGLCSYEDAVGSYEFTWGIKLASERK